MNWENNESSIDYTSLSSNSEHNTDPSKFFGKRIASHIFLYSSDYSLFQQGDRLDWQLYHIETRITVDVSRLVVVYLCVVARKRKICITKIKKRTL